MTVKPLKPNEAVALKKSFFPDDVIQTWNEMIASKLDSSGSANIKIGEIAEALATVMNVDRNTVFTSGWLEIEDIYRAEGWTVYFDKAVAWGGDNYESYYLFTGAKSK